MIVTVDNITKKYGKHRVLNGISLELNPGECIGILGGNGCGKSTLLAILAGITKADSGSFTAENINLLKNVAARSRLVGYVPQGVPLFNELTAKDNLLLWYSHSELKRQLDDGVLKMLGIDEFLNVRVGRMSGGMKKRLSIGCAMYNSPKLLLLDEPSAALDLICKERVLSYLKSFTQQGGTVLIATHDIPEIEFCDRTFIMKDGVLNRFEYNGNVHDLVGEL